MSFVSVLLLGKGGCSCIVKNVVPIKVKCGVCCNPKLMKTLNEPYRCGNSAFVWHTYIFI